MAEWKIGDPVPERTPESVRLRFGDRLRRLREEVGLTQAEAAGELGISQPVVSKAEKSGVASEEVLRGMWVLYGVPESYPEAPCDPVRRREWFGARNGDRMFFPRGQVTGTGVPPKEKAA